MRRLALAALVTVLALAGCGGSGGGSAGSADQGGGGNAATVWVTHDRGAEVVLTATVPAGLTVLQALDRVADVETRYGGRFVQAINGAEGSLDAQRDWFYFLNGIEPDVGAAEVRLRPGDIAWWDLRSWKERMEEPVVVGAFPEPFRNGWSGRPRPLELGFPPELAEAAEALRQLLEPGAGTGEPNVFLLELAEGPPGAVVTASRGPRNDSPVVFRLAGSLAGVRAAASALARDPGVVRFRYTARFDEAGNVVG